MKYFFDTEFIEDFYEDVFDRKRHFIELISIGIKCEDGREFYAISNEYDFDEASTWVKKNVIKPMYDELSPAEQRKWRMNEFHKHFGHSKAQIAKDIQEFAMLPFVGSAKKPEIEFYAYYGAYDWIALVTLFGIMIDLPKHFPMFVHDLKQTMEELELDKSWKDKHCPVPAGEHNALVDAKWNFELFKKLEQVKHNERKHTKHRATA